MLLRRLSVARILKADAEMLLGRVPDDRVFWCCDGGIVVSMRQLGEALNIMADETFTYHSNDERKDFACWVKDVIGDEKLARDLTKAPNRNQAAKRVMERIDFLSAKL